MAKWSACPCGVFIGHGSSNFVTTSTGFGTTTSPFEEAIDRVRCDLRT